MTRGLLVCLGLAVAGCHDTSENAEVSPEAALGFVVLEADTYRVQATQLQSGDAALFYAFRPAVSDADTAPLFVVTTGGPGGPVLLLVEQLERFREIGHTLFIDARNAGFSYVIDPRASEATVRAARLGAADYNVFRDAGDVAQVLLAFFARHPEHAQRDVYFVAESYGGARTAVLLDLFLSASTYASGERPFFSAALQSRLEAHLLARFGELPSPVVAAQGFRGQILLQPVIAGQLQDEVAGELFEQPGSILDELAEISGTPYVRCTDLPAPCDPFANAHAFVEGIGRSRYDYRQPTNWLDSLLEGADTTAADPELLATAFGVSPTTVVHQLAGRDPNAFRFSTSAANSTTVLDQWLPALPVWDAYFVALHSELPTLFRSEAVQQLDAHPDSSFLPDLFVSNAHHAVTLITRADYDLHIFAPALPVVLERMSGIAGVVAGSQLETLMVTFEDGTQRTIYAPHFAASHAVGHDDPEALLRAIADFVTIQ